MTKDNANKSPLVSVIIPTYNRANKIVRAVSSCLSQTYKNIEIIIVDDASTDKTKTTISSIVKRNPRKRIRYIRLIKNKGETGARIEGILASKGIYIAFLDSDDELTTESIRWRLNTLIQSRYKNGMVYGDILLNGEKRTFTKKRGYSFKYLLAELSLCSPNTILVSKSCFENRNLPTPGFPSWGDDDLVLTIGRKYPIIHCGEVVAKQYTSLDSVSNSSYNNYVGCKMMFNKYYRDIKSQLGVGRIFLWHLRVFRSYISYIRSKFRVIDYPLHVFQHILDKLLYNYFDNIFV